jgi:hypothetical protein
MLGTSSNRRFLPHAQTRMLASWQSFYTDAYDHRLLNLTCSTFIFNTFYIMSGHVDDMRLLDKGVPRARW